MIPEVHSYNVSKDGTVKFLMFDPSDKNNKYETIYIPEKKMIPIVPLRLAVLWHVNFVKLGRVDLIET